MDSHQPGPRWPLGDALTDVRDELLAAYSTGRGYHDLRHLAEVLDRIAELAPTVACDRTSVELAAWFHDSVYDGERDAEERSALWAAEALAELPDRDEVVRLVRLTETHRPDDDDVNGCVLSDADLAILAAPAERYAEYVADVRREFADLPDDVFAAGRAQVLASLLDKDHLFHTAQARNHWEAPARANVAAEFDRLASTQV